MEMNALALYASHTIPGVLAVYAPGKETRYKPDGALVPEPVTWTCTQDG
jgi:hypothetical protein